MAKNIVIGGTTYANTNYVRFTTAEGGTATFIEETRDCYTRIVSTGISAQCMGRVTYGTFGPVTASFGSITASLTD